MAFVSCEVMTYTDAQISQIESVIMREHQRKAQSAFNIDGKSFRNDWDEAAFVSEQLYEDFLSAVQMGAICKKTQQRYTQESSFEDYLRDCLDTLEYRIRELSDEQARGVIDLSTYNSAKEVAERARTAISHHLEKSETAQLIGV